MSAGQGGADLARAGIEASRGERAAAQQRRQSRARIDPGGQFGYEMFKMWPASCIQYPRLHIYIPSKWKHKERIIECKCDNINVKWVCCVYDKIEISKLQDLFNTTERLAYLLSLLWLYICTCTSSELIWLKIFWWLETTHSYIPLLWLREQILETLLSGHLLDFPLYSHGAWEKFITSTNDLGSFSRLGGWVWINTQLVNQEKSF